MLVLSLVMGVMLGVHPNNSLTISERIIDSARLRASVVAMVNATMPLGQIIVGLASGPLIHSLMGRIELYFAFVGVLHGLVLCLSSGIMLIEFGTD